VDELAAKMSAIYHKVDPQLGVYFDIMRQESLLDLDNRKGKAPGGYNATLPLTKKPFIYMNAIGPHRDVQTLLHEGGHAFHVFETNHWDYAPQRDYPIEFAEVASMAMEMLGAPYLVAQAGGYYSESEAARARIQHLEKTLKFFPYMAVVDAFQHWAYNNPEMAADPANCDAAWGDLWDRFMKGIDYSGLEDSKVTGWHRKLHIFRVPMYYVEYGLAQCGAIQVYGRARQDQAQAVRDYRRALSLGYTVSLPELFAAAGATFGFDVDTVQGVTDVVMNTIAELENSAG
jgi:oligoendopeptidase F